MSIFCPYFMMIRESVNKIITIPFGSPSSSPSSSSSSPSHSSQLRFSSSSHVYFQSKLNTNHYQTLVSLVIVCFTTLMMTGPVYSVPRIRNYASNECGAKAVAANQGAEGTSRILNEMVDEYLLNPCKSPIWFVVELCDFLQPHMLELANYELFSSTPKEFMVFGSENYPTNEWISLGSFSAEDTRVIQRFELQSQAQFLKYIKIVITSHHGREHYCPLSVVRVFGTSMLEELDAIEGGTPSENKFDYHEEPVPVEPSLTTPPTSHEAADSSKRTNSIGSAHEAVMSVLRRAAMALSRFSLHPSGNISQNDLMDQQSRELNVSEVYRLSLSSLKLMPWLEKELSRCKDCVHSDERLSLLVSSSDLSQKATSSSLPSSSSITCNNTSPNERLCDYFKSMLGLEMYVILCEEINKEPHLRFRCPLVPDNYPNNTLPKLIFEENLVPSYPLTRPSFPDSVHDTIAHQSLPHLHHTLNQGVTPSSSAQVEPTEKLSPTSVLQDTISSFTSILVDPLLNRVEKSSENSVKDTLSTPHEEEKEIGSSNSQSSSEIIGNENWTDFQQQQQQQPGVGSPSSDATDSVASSLTDVKSNISNVPSQDGAEPPFDVNVPSETENLSSSSAESGVNSSVNNTSDLASSNIPATAASSYQTPPSTHGQTNSDPPYQSHQAAVLATTGTGGAAATWANGPPISASQAKESVFIRMSNKIKALEFNLSQSTLYLEEFSQKFRKNMDDVQRAFNRTINKLNETAMLAEEKDNKQQEMLETLQVRLISLQSEVRYLRENDSINWQIIEVHLVLFFVEFSIMIFVLLICWRKTTKHLEEKYHSPIHSTSEEKTKVPKPLSKNIVIQCDHRVNKQSHFNSTKLFPTIDNPESLKRLNSCPELLTLVSGKIDFELDGVWKYNDLRRYGPSY
ncbi:SUN domain-containing ossification factor [Brevipalpus obovatus]|uniref:SUN domain-containing ossification factor n=1 Tax=Brevipalpus obovatus TaxID=246614 RepID=UPI003D9EE9B3